MGGQRLDIHDDLHGTVHLLPHERAILDSPWVQRLRRIHQLGVASMVFPGAEHTRFAHSIGVFHLASRIADRFSDVLDCRARRELRAAALLHDVGHFPFSHSLESVYEARAARELKKPSPQTAEQAVEPGSTQPAGQQHPFAHFTPDDPAAMHERFGQLVVVNTDVDGGVTRALKQCQPELDPSRVGQIVVAEHPRMLLKQIVKSDLDVDQLDYLLRDAKATGSTYGQYDIDYLVECLEVVDVEGEPMLCVHIRGLHVVEHYALAKYFYYLCILSHKTRCVIEGILKSVASELIGAGVLPKWNELREQVSSPRFCEFDDAHVVGAMRRACADGKVNQQVACAIGMLLRRELPKVTRERHTLAPRAQNVEQVPRQLPSPDDWNEVIRGAVEWACSQRVPVLTPAREDPITDEDRLRDVLLNDSGPIRIFVEQPFELAANTPVLPGTTSAGAKGQVTLLECLDKSSTVAALTGYTTHIERTYRPYPG